MKPFFSAVPWITVGVLLLLIRMIGGTMTVTNGVRIDLPADGADVVGGAELTAYLFGSGERPLVFFEDVRYVVGDSASMSELASRFEESVSSDAGKTLLVIADRNIPNGDTFELAGIARKSGIRQIVFATRDPDRGR